MGRLTIAVIIATRGRADVAGRLIRHLGAQTRRPDRVILSVASPTDAPKPAAGAEIVCGPAGLAAQRNSGLNAVADMDVAVFYDDDFVPAPGALEAIEQLFATRPEIAGATGHVAADGATGPEIADDAAADICRRLHLSPPPWAERPVIGLYGCNMAIRLSAAGGLRFDEALPLYGWQEDLDFGARLSARGLVIRTTAFTGVHRGVKSARPVERGLGYAQIANPAYLMRRGDIPAWYLLRLMARNVAANHLGALMGGDGTDRMGRVRGNWRAFRDLARGRLAPGRAADL